MSFIRTMPRHLRRSEFRTISPDISFFPAVRVPENSPTGPSWSLPMTNGRKLRYWPQIPSRFPSFIRIQRVPEGLDALCVGDLPRFTPCFEHRAASQAAICAAVRFRASAPSLFDPSMKPTNPHMIALTRQRSDEPPAPCRRLLSSLGLPHDRAWLRPFESPFGGALRDPGRAGGDGRRVCPVCTCDGFFDATGPMPANALRFPRR